MEATVIECAFVFDEEGAVIHWHLPEGRSAGHIPDTRGLWEVMWENRHILGGVAHTHPWRGKSGPSGTDITTFAACEAALGKRLTWPIVTMDSIACFWWQGPDKHRYRMLDDDESPVFEERDLAKLRGLSYGFRGPALEYHVLTQVLLDERKRAEKIEERIMDQMDDAWQEMSPEEREAVGQLTEQNRG